jgi:hypothetical protein
MLGADSISLVYFVLQVTNFIEQNASLRAAGRPCSQDIRLLFVEPGSSFLRFLSFSLFRHASD